MDTVIEFPRRAGSLTLKGASTGRARVARPDYPVWERRGLELARSFQTSQWDWGLWWVEGTPWSPRRTALVNRPDWAGPGAKRLRTIGYVYRRQRTSLYKDVLSFSHHEAVASLPFDLAMEFLGRALHQGWIVERLKADIASHRQSQPMDSNNVAPLTPVQLTRKYTALVIDPPWGFDHPAIQHRILRHYLTLSIERIKELPVGDLLTKDAYVFLFAPNALLEVAMAVLRAWGFPYAAHHMWAKQTKRLGTGNYWRNGHEVMVMGTRGKAGQFLDKTLNSWLLAAPGKHSEKPEAFFRMIERAVPGPYVEAFARTRRPGWDVVWSDEIHG